MTVISFQWVDDLIDDFDGDSKRAFRPGGTISAYAQQPAVHPNVHSGEVHFDGIHSGGVQPGNNSWDSFRQGLGDPGYTEVVNGTSVLTETIFRKFI